ncbi:hypothetical protein MZL76_001092, partial [Pseudomonas aeruginosa]
VAGLIGKVTEELQVGNEYSPRTISGYTSATFEETGNSWMKHRDKSNMRLQKALPLTPSGACAADISKVFRRTPGRTTRSFDNYHRSSATI